MAFAKVKLLESTDVEVEELQLNCGKSKGDLQKIIFVSMTMMIIIMIIMINIMAIMVFKIYLVNSHGVHWENWGVEFWNPS